MRTILTYVTGGGGNFIAMLLSDQLKEQYYIGNNEYKTETIKVNLLEMFKHDPHAVQSCNVFRSHYIGLIKDFQPWLNHYGVYDEFQSLSVYTADPKVRHYTNLLGMIKRYTNRGSYFGVRQYESSNSKLNLDERHYVSKWRGWHGEHRGEDRLIVDPEIVKHNFHFQSEYENIVPTIYSQWSVEALIQGAKVDREWMRCYFNSLIDQSKTFQERRWKEMDDVIHLYPTLFYEEMFLEGYLEDRFKPHASRIEEYHLKNIQLLNDIDRTFGSELSSTIPT